MMLQNFLQNLGFLEYFGIVPRGVGCFFHMSLHY